MHSERYKQALDVCKSVALDVLDGRIDDYGAFRKLEILSDNFGLDKSHLIHAKAELDFKNSLKTSQRVGLVEKNNKVGKANSSNPFISSSTGLPKLDLSYSHSKKPSYNKQNSGLNLNKSFLTNIGSINRHAGVSELKGRTKITLAGGLNFNKSFLSSGKNGFFAKKAKNSLRLGEVKVLKRRGVF